MKPYKITITPFGSQAIIIQWPNTISDAILNDILAFKSHLQNSFDPGFEYVASYNSITLIYPDHKFDFKSLKNQIIKLYTQDYMPVKQTYYCWKMPVCYESEFAVDMPFLEDQLQLSSADIVKLHTTHQYKVFGIGFLPGFMYLGGLPKVLETKRKNAPQLLVEKGAVGLAGLQTGIYPQDSPGGWNIIGKCPVPLFNAQQDQPCFVKVGDKVQFTPISKAQFEVLTIQAQVGILKPEKEILHA